MKPRIGLTCSTLVLEEGAGVRRLQVPESYVERVVEAGGLPLLLPIASPAWACDYLEGLDGLLLIGGDDVDPALYGAERHAHLGPVDRSRDEFEIALVRAVARSGLPSLGICRGLQVMNVALGGTLIQHVPEDVPGALGHGGHFDEAHGVTVEPGTELAKVVGEGAHRVNSHHHQAIERAASTLRISARAPDGVIEGGEVLGHPFFLGVQWHPERMEGADSTRRLFAAFLAAAQRARG